MNVGVAKRDVDRDEGEVERDVDHVTARLGIH